VEQPCLDAKIVGGGGIAHKNKNPTRFFTTSSNLPKCMVGLRWRSMSQMRLTGLQLAWYARNSYLLGVLHALLLGRAASTCLPGAGSLSGQRGKVQGKLPVSAWGLARRQAMKAWLTGCWDWRRMCTKTARRNLASGAAHVVAPWKHR